MPTYKLENFPLYQQLDNDDSPYGTCNVTSVAMCLDFLGIDRNPKYKRFTQFEDELSQYCLDNGLNRESPNDLVRLIQYYGGKDTLLMTDKKLDTDNAILSLIQHLKNNKPAIAHTYLTASGHIVCIVGVQVDDKGFPISWHIHDPYGEYYSGGYDKNFGDNQTVGAYPISHSLFTDKISEGGSSIWVHLVDN